MERYVCIDIGGTAIKYGLLDENAVIIEQNQTATEASKGGLAVLNKVKEIVHKYVLYHEISGICISTAGVVDPIHGSIVHANENIPAYKGICLKKELEEEFMIPCEVENDVNCAGLAEYWNGAAKGCDNALCLTIGTGIGGCAIIHGGIIRGASFSACEIGYMNICGNNFEKIASVTALVNKVADEKKEDRTCWSGKKVFKYAEKGDKICINALAEMADILGLGIANICYVLNPEVVILGGGIMEEESILTMGIRQAVNRHLLHTLYSHMRIELAYHHNAAGMIGAWYNFKNKYICSEP